LDELEVQLGEKREIFGSGFTKVHRTRASPLRLPNESRLSCGRR
jgi:hypothetical protein